MSTICQSSATLTTTTVRTTSTIYVTTSTQQIAGRPFTSTVIVPTSTCHTAGTGSSATVACATSASTMVTVITPAASQAQVVVTMTRQIVQTQLNTLFGTLCHTVPGPGPTPAVTDTTFTTHYVTVTGPSPTLTSSTDSSLTSRTRSTFYGSPADSTSESTPSDTAIAAVSNQSNSITVPIGAIVGAVIGGIALAALAGFLVYYFFFKKSSSAKGYKAPGKESSDLDAHYYDNGRPLHASEQAGYHSQGYDGSYPMSGQGVHYLQPQGLTGENMYADDPSAAISGFQAAPRQSYGSSSPPPPGGYYSHQPHLSTDPLINYGSPYPHPVPHAATSMLPYRGYAEPGDG